MKKSLLVLIVLTLFAGSALALTNGEIKKCTGKLHACFQANYGLLVDLNPQTPLDCESACTGGLANLNDHSCDLIACISRCEVAFSISNVMCQ